MRARPLNLPHKTCLIGQTRLHMLAASGAASRRPLCSSACHLRHTAPALLPLILGDSCIPLGHLLAAEQVVVLIGDDAAGLLRRVDDVRGCPRKPEDMPGHSLSLNRATWRR